MARFRPRIAVGTFASAGDVEVMVDRLQALGITRYERLSLPPDPQNPVAGGGRLDPMPPATATLRIYLDTSTQEQIVAGALLASTACSVQLHDIDEGGRA